MNTKNSKGMIMLSVVLSLALLFYLNLEDYQEQRLHMLINDFLLSW